jgi:hypothetical protein
MLLGQGLLPVPLEGRTSLKLVLLNAPPCLSLVCSVLRESITFAFAFHLKERAYFPCMSLRLVFSVLAYGGCHQDHYD